MEAVREAIPQAAGDPMRPVYHFRPPARWMNGSDGLVFHCGYYHLFYQLNPCGDQWGVNHTVWGHTRSRNLVHWEHLPVAIPTPPGLARINSGCVVIDEAGRPLALFPAVFADERPREIWAATSDDDMVEWHFHSANPIMTFETHGGPRYEKWDQPFIFREGGRTFMILSSCYLGDSYVVPLYETDDPQMLRWDYRGILYEIPLGSDTPYLESPMIMKDGQRWALIGTPVGGGACRYYSGNLDLTTLRFEAHQEGILIHGAGPREQMPGGGTDRGLIPGSVYHDHQDRHIMLGWQSAFGAGRGWYGCTCLPRILSIGADGRPRQTPAPELQVLRGKHACVKERMLESGSQVLPEASGDVMEILAEFEPRGAGEFGLKVRRSPDGSRAILICCNGRSLEVAGTKMPLELDAGDTLRLHVFLDKSVLEVFVNDGWPCVTRVINAQPADLGLEWFAGGGEALLRSIDVWQMDRIWDD
jgi:beta-fructofuranosidase